MKRLIFVFTFAIIVAGVGFALTRQSNLFQVRSIPIEFIEDGGSEQAPFRTDAVVVDDLRARLARGLRNFEKKKLWEIDIDQVNAWLRADEWVQRAHVTRVFPNRLQISVAPRAPVFLLATAKGQMRPVTADASLLGAVENARLPDVPVLRGQPFLTDANLRRRAVEFARQLPSDGPMSSSCIAEINWSAGDGFSILLLPSRTEVKLGEGRIDLKIARVEQILDYLDAHQLKGRVIDASFSKKVLVRLRKGP